MLIQHEHFGLPDPVLLRGYPSMHMSKSKKYLYYVDQYAGLDFSAVSFLLKILPKLEILQIPLLFLNLKEEN